MDEEEVIIKDEPANIGEIIEDVEKVDDLETVATTSKIEPAYAVVYVCAICMKVFGHEDLFEQHLKVMHRPLTINILSGAYCDLCKNIFDEYKYNFHLPQCTTAFNNKLLDLVHNLPPRNPNECAICYKTFGHLNKLTDHLRTVHRPITINYQNRATFSFCDTCKHLFKDDLLSSHFPCNAVDVKCFFCLTKMPLMHHFLDHSLLWQGFRKFQCSICTKDTKFMNFTELHEHIKGHNGLGVYQCVKCKLHMDQTYLEVHYQKCHGGCTCFTNPCCCKQYNEYFYMKHILKINEVPIGNLKSTHKAIKTYAYVKLPNRITQKTYNCPVSSLECSSKIQNKSENILSSPNSSNTSITTNLINKSKTVLDNENNPTAEELIKTDVIDKKGFRKYYVVKNFKRNASKPKPKLSKRHLTKLRIERFTKLPNERLSELPKDNLSKLPNERLSELPKENLSELPKERLSELPKDRLTKLPKKRLTKYQLKKQKRLIMSQNRKKSKQEQSKFTENSKTKTDDQNSVVTKENDCSTSEVAESNQQKSVQNLNNEKNSSQNEEKSINTKENNLEDQISVDGKQFENSTNSSDPKISTEVNQQENQNSDDIEMYQIQLVNDENDEQDTHKINSTSGNEASKDEEISVDQALDDVENEHFPESLPGSQISSDLENNEHSDCNNTQACVACDICGLDFSNLSSLHKHYLQYHQLRSSYVRKILTKTVYCAFCRIYTTKKHFPCLKNAALEKCHFCNMSLPKKEHFELHNIEFLSYNTMFCTLCNNNTEYKMKTLNEHRIKDHKDIGAFECVICKDKFSSNIKLKEHLVHSKHKFDVKNSASTYRLLRNHRDALKYYKCKHCQRICFTQRVLNNHKCNTFALCYICGLTCKHSSHLKEHLNKHLKTESFNCRICDKTFMTRKHKVQHQKIHETRKEFECLECSQTFTQQTSLIYHMATHTNENVFKCSVCDILFDKQSKLTAHMQIHNDNGTNPHKCDVCKKLFTHKCKMLVHKRMHRINNKD